MTARKRNLLPKGGKRAREQPTGATPTRSAAEQTRASWARHIDTYDAVPAVYRSFFDPLQAAGQALPYTVLTPSFEGLFNRMGEKLVCDMGREIYVLEKIGHAFEARSYPLAGIDYLEIRTILLDARVTIGGATGDGVPATSMLRFNSITDYLLTPILERARRDITGASQVVQPSELEKFDHLMRVNFKFMNYAKRSLLGGEEVVQTILQPEIRLPVLTFLGLTWYRIRSPTHMSILTDRELIVIREEAHKSGRDRYGGTWQYIPLTRIAALSVGERADGLLALSIRLRHGARFENLYRPAARPEIDQFLARFRELAATDSQPNLEVQVCRSN